MALRVGFIVSGVEVGGAELTMLALLDALEGEIDPFVVSLSGDGPVADLIRRKSIPLYIRDFKSRYYRAWHELKALRKIIDKNKPDLVQTWMYHADLIGGLTARKSRIPVIWNIRNSTLDRRTAKASTIAIMRVCGMLSGRIPNRIICCAASARDIHVDKGYSGEKFEVIPNGVDSRFFYNDMKGGAEFRKRYGLKQDTKVIGFAGRFHPQKDHETFLRAARELVKENWNVKYVLCGPGNDPDTGELTDLVEKYDLREHVHLAGIQTSMPSVLSALDVFSMTSTHGEAFPNVVAEAMACEVPCVVTDVGDAALIVSECGYVCRPGDYKDIADKWMKILNMNENERQRLSQRCRARIVTEFSVAETARRYLKVYREALDTACVV